MSERTKIKICGFTEPEAAVAAVFQGADFIGLNFWPESPRAVDFYIAKVIGHQIRRVRNPRRPKHKAKTVAVFVDPPRELVEGVLAQVQPDVLQFHGEETPEFCRSFDHPFLKAHRIKSVTDIARIPDFLGGKAIGFLVDAFSPVSPGGTGVRLSIALVEQAMVHPGGFVAGGLNPDNVGEVVSRLHPYAVDVASGVEMVRGRKHVGLIDKFIKAVETASEGKAI